jgi:hypothetical protein
MPKSSPNHASAHTRNQTQYHGSDGGYAGISVEHWGTIGSGATISPTEPQVRKRSFATQSRPSPAHQPAMPRDQHQVLPRSNYLNQTANGLP